MRQLDLFQPVENIKPQSDTPKGKVNGGMNIVSLQPTKSRPASSEPEPTKVVEPKEEEKIGKPQPIQKEQAFNGKRGRKSFKEMDADLVMVEVPDDEILFQKKYYAISEVAQWFHVNASLLRYWENEFDVLKPRKTRKGDRLFRPEDIKNLHLIYFLLRQRKFSIEGAKQYLKENKKKADVQMQLIQSLTKFRTFLLEWKANLGA
jgi:DNA-binding transcriptional MerR regulator